MSKPPLYFQNRLVVRAIELPVPPNPVGPNGDIPRETASGNKDPLGGPSKKGAFALANHHCRIIEDGLLLSGEQERSDII